MMAQKDANKIIQTGLLSTIIIVGLLVLSFLPEINFGEYHMKKIDILSDIRPDTRSQQPGKSDVAIPDTIFEEQIIPVTVNRKITRIEDFSGEDKILKHFYKALQNADTNQVRVAFFGDSFIEGDIISATLRDTLQKVFGGSGVGIVPLASEVAGFRKSIKHTYASWDTYTLLTPNNTTIPIGISGYTYIPRENNMVRFKPGQIPLQENFKQVKVLYQNTESTTINYNINEEPAISQNLEKSDKIKQLVITHDNINSIQLRISPPDNIVVFGVSFEHNYGTYVDNFSLRRNSGISLSRLSPELLKQFNNYLDYKLIILQYGLNVASETDSTNYEWYTTRMIKIIKDLKVIFPETSFLLLSVSDRATNRDGKVVTMHGIPKMRNMQRDIAIKSGIAFWDLFEAMGGRNSIISYTEAVPPLAARDYTHLTHLGGKKIGKKLADALLFEINRHD